MKFGYVNFGDSLGKGFFTLVALVIITFLSIVAYQEGREFFIGFGWFLVIVGSIAALLFSLAGLWHLYDNYFHPEARYDRMMAKQEKEEAKKKEKAEEDFKALWE